MDFDLAAFEKWHPEDGARCAGEDFAEALRGTLLAETGSFGEAYASVPAEGCAITLEVCFDPRRGGPSLNFTFASGLNQVINAGGATLATGDPPRRVLEDGGYWLQVRPEGVEIHRDYTVSDSIKALVGALPSDLYLRMTASPPIREVSFHTQSLVFGPFWIRRDSIDPASIVPLRARCIELFRQLEAVAGKVSLPGD